MKKVFYLAQFVLLFSLVVVLFRAKAATEATVGATVTFQNVGVTISSGSVNYGTMSSSQSQNTNALTQTQTATNAGNVNSIMTIKGTTTAAWTLGATTAANQYVHKFCTASCATPPTNYSALTTNYATLAGSVADSGTQDFDLEIIMPSTSSSYSQQSPNVMVMIAAN